MTATTTANPPTGRLKVRGVYIIPSGQQEKPQGKEAIAAILAMMQWHFLQQIGVTFEYEPEVAIIRTNADAPAAMPPRPASLAGRKLQWSPSRKAFRDAQTGEVFDVNGKPMGK